MKNKESVLEWLLGDDNPPVKYLTLKNILCKSQTSKEVRRARSQLMEYDPTLIILDQFEEFIHETNRYRRYWKYTGTYWQFIFLGQFLADGRDERIQRLADLILSDKNWINRRGGQCLTANILSACMRLGLQDHPVVRHEIENLARRVALDNGITCEVMEYSLLSKCHMAIPKLLLCFSEIAESERSGAVHKAIRVLADALTGKEVYKYVSSHHREWTKVLEGAPRKKDLPKGETVKAWLADRKAVFLADGGFGDKVAKKGWLKFGFPLHYNSDILEAMYALALLGVPYSAELEEPLAVIKHKMTGEGKWILENSLNGKMIADVEEKGRPSKWITYFALMVLEHFSVGSQMHPVRDATHLK